MADLRAHCAQPKCKEREAILKEIAKADPGLVAAAERTVRGDRPRRATRPWHERNTDH